MQALLSAAPPPGGAAAAAAATDAYGRVPLVSRRKQQLCIACQCAAVHALERCAAELASLPPSVPPPQHYAAGGGHLPTLQLLLGVAPGSAAVQDEGGDYPLHAAAAAGLEDAVRLLLPCAPDAISAPGRTGLTPIELALGSNSLNETSGAQRQVVVRLLLGAAPAGDLLPALQRAGRQRGWPLIPDAVAAHMPLSDDDWELVRRGW